MYAYIAEVNAAHSINNSCTSNFQSVVPFIIVMTCVLIANAQMPTMVVKLACIIVQGTCSQNISTFELAIALKRSYAYILWTWYN